MPELERCTVSAYAQCIVESRVKQNLAVDDLIKNVEKGIYIIGDGSFSIDQQRYNFQFGGQIFYEIKNGKISGMLNDVAYQANTQEFWNSCAAIAMKAITVWAALLMMVRASPHNQTPYRTVVPPRVSMESM